MITSVDISRFCQSNDYDIRKRGSGRWIDQKCTPDVLCVIADCVAEYVRVNGKDSIFSAVDIWHSEYADENVKLIFNKPGVTHEMARKEYDKFFAQPLELLAYSGILEKNRTGRTNHYSVCNEDLLEFIALRERNALVFLNSYIEAVLSDSAILGYFEKFFEEQTADTYMNLKEMFVDFTIRYTPINGRIEVRRIFTKIVNPMAFLRKKCGTKRGRMSKDIISMDMLMYNRLNFRDIYADKPRNMTRKEYADANPVEINEAFYHYQSAKAKKFIRIWNDQFRNGESEYSEGIAPDDKATNIHHIFPEALYPEISFFLENLIALTPTQHFNNAHNQFRTQEIDEQYQHILLLAKAEIVEWNIETPTVETIYELSKFIYVLSIGFDNDELLENELDYPSVVYEINHHYA
jgi:hypothetical protein